VSNWLRKTRPPTVDIRAAERYEQSWVDQAVPDWLDRQPSLLQEHRLTDRPDMLTPYNTRFSADVPGLSAYGGMALFIGFTQKMGLGKLLARHLCMPKRQSRYSPAQLCECVIDAIACGISRIENTNLLHEDPLLPTARGLARFPDHATLHRFITDFTAENVEQLHALGGALLKKTNRLKKLTRVTLDFDATDAVVYGQQEQAAFGHKNARDGHREYSIETCFLGASKDVLHHRVRSGNTKSVRLDPETSQGMSKEGAGDPVLTLLWETG
jgi:hypothetical protein